MKAHFGASQTILWPGLTFILAVATLLRFYELGLPSQWYDEMNLTLTALNPALFIVKRSLVMDTHPPTFALLTKAAQILAHNDFAMRVVPALAGLGGVLAVFFLGNSAAGPGAGLWAAALLALNPSHILYSREVRPYTLFLLAFLFMLQAFHRYLDRQDRRSLLTLSAANAILLLLHFLSFLLVAAQGLMVLAMLAASREKRLRAFFAYCAATVVAALPGAVFMLARMGKEAAYDSSPWAVISRYGLNAWRVLFENVPLPLAMLLLAALAIGLAVLWRGNRRLAWMFLGFAALPCVILSVGGYNSYFAPWHLSFLMPLAAICAGAGLARVPLLRSRPAPALFAACACAAIFLLTPHLFYRVQSNHGVYKPTAARLLPLLRNGDTWYASDFFSARALNWYLSDSGVPDFREPGQLPGSDGKSFLLLDFSESSRSGTPEVTGFSRLGKPRHFQDIEGARVFRWDLPAPVPLSVSPGGENAHLTADPDVFLRHAMGVRHMTFLPHGGNVMIPLHIGVPGRFEAVWRNNWQQPQFLSFTLGLRNTGGRGLVRASLVFDSEPPVTVFESAAPDNRPSVMITYSRTQPFRECMVKLEFIQNEPAAGMDMCDLYPVAFKELLVLQYPLPPDFAFPERSEGLGPVEEVGGSACRWGFGPSSTFRFHAQTPGPFRLRYSLFNPLEGQVVRTAVNGETVNRYGAIPAFPGIMFADNEVVFQAQAGENTVTLQYALFNRLTPDSTFAPQDHRSLAVLLREVRIEPIP